MYIYIYIYSHISYKFPPMCTHTHIQLDIPMFKYLLTLKFLFALIKCRYLIKYYYFIKILKYLNFWHNVTTCINLWTGNFFIQSLKQFDLGCKFSQAATPLCS